MAEVDGLTAEWLSEALGARVDAVRWEPVGTGQIGSVFRGHLAGHAVPPTLLAKLPSPDPATRELLAGAYRGEVRFYADLAPTVAVRVPACYYAVAAAEGGDFTLLLEDLAPRRQGDQVAGCGVEPLRDAVVNLAGLHGPRWCDPTLLDVEGLSLSGPDDAAMLADLYGPTVDLFVDGREHLLADEDVATLRDCVEVTAAWVLGRAERFGLVHGDYRLDNLMFPPAGHDVVAVDWQTLSLALPARDLAYVVATSLEPATRRAHERSLVASYHRALVDHGVTGYDGDTCWDDYRWSLLQGPLVAVFGCAYGARTERGDRMFAAMVTRSCAAIRDLGVLDDPSLGLR
ncbi:phosphotransferase [Nocardioides sp. SYSU D00038]|uniref:phosphotransferase n=1 Tax=Nocardioides sp. SYSU D00038 TaxID=2812554 RepID=UPI0019676F7E|nr:phosphotransferase [Nocardioides sp. SYSU D00038]